MSVEADLRHAFRGFELDVTLRAGPGVTAIFGPSGSGKTTIINMISGLLHPDQGRVVIDGASVLDTAARRNIPPHKRRIGYVFQDGRLFPHLSVAGNIRFGARFAHSDPIASETEIVDLLGLAPLMERLPGALSGGERQRVALARALLSAPRLLLMDEPLAALDEPRKDEILPYLEALRDRTGLPILYVSHSVAEVARLADHLILLQNGKIALSGSTQDILSTPAALPFLGVREAGSILRARVLGHDPDGLSRLQLSSGELVLPRVDAKVGESLVIRILAQDVLIALQHPEGLSSRNILPVTVEGLHRGGGPGVAVSLRLGEDVLLARVTARAADDLALRPGLDCFAVLKATTVPRRNIGHDHIGDAPFHA
ncbi:molybdenum ABC transporter ATP-binding protein [Roseovarius faecimaris]|uniref:Molybdenum ABC transporter ATP-binding protein n=1 Tax=Roseovarius faecimaris TaxID=2494550 RepID=A0A6I6ILR4_9RHOB|nr:molybdenum ABC transporter ATP-binding protein [Roseovarius faecimaris]QGX97515.1 molybdenum ABC transporter ATP-binding protein [Roseovarius faecimaris]